MLSNPEALAGGWELVISMIGISPKIVVHH